MVVDGAHAAHPGSPDTLLADSRNNDLLLVAMRCAASRRDAVVVTQHVSPSANQGPLMRPIPSGLTTTLAPLALASSPFAATNANTLSGPVGPDFPITRSKPTVKAG